MKAKAIFFSLAGAFALMQFFPIDKTLPPTTAEAGLHVAKNPPDEIFSLIKNACYDCHSSHTRYPWYTRIQPVGWWVQGHVEQGRKELNFSEIGRWREAEQRDLLEHCARILEKGVMPLKSYLNMHPEARLDERQRQLLIDWFRQAGSNSMTVGRHMAAPSDSCEGDNENVYCCFAGMPDSLSAEMYIAGKDEPGERLLIRGQVFRKDGKTPYPGVVIYAYHTDVKGIYAKDGSETGIRKWHGRLHGWCETDAEGRYAIHTIRPARYPGNTIPGHIHEVLREPDGKKPCYINDTVFDDDDLIDARYRAQEKRGLGGSGIVTLSRNADGVWSGKRDIFLR